MFELVAVCVSGAALLVGCQRAYALGEKEHLPTPQELAGTWVASGPDGAIASYTFASDGTWTSADIPAIDDRGCVVDWTTTSDYSGTWALVPHDEDSGNAARVETGAADGWGARLLTLGDNGKVRLFSTICDPDAGRRLFYDKAE